MGCKLMENNKFSINNREIRFEKGRKDDIWSLIYILIEMHCGLPWQKEKNKKKLQIKKMTITDKELFRNFPGIFSNFLSKFSI